MNILPREKRLMVLGALVNGNEPPRDPFITKKAIFGAPVLDTATTSYVERQNGTMRQFLGRIRRLVYAFSKKIDHHRAAVALAYTHYNLCHVVKTRRVTPAMQAGITDHVWTLDEFLDELLAAVEVAPPVKRPLIHQKPEEPHRELPSGRGFLRLVPGPEGTPKPGDASTTVVDEPKEPS
jgi:hypothetical protein